MLGLHTHSLPQVDEGGSPFLSSPHPCKPSGSVLLSHIDPKAHCGGGEGEELSSEPAPREKGLSLLHLILWGMWGTRNRGLRWVEGHTGSRRWELKRRIGSMAGRSSMAGVQADCAARLPTPSVPLIPSAHTPRHQTWGRVLNRWFCVGQNTEVARKQRWQRKSWSSGQSPGTPVLSPAW